MASSPYGSCSSTRLISLPQQLLERLAWFIHQDRQRAAGFSGCMSVHPLTQQEGALRWGWVHRQHMLPLVLSGCRLHQTEEKSRLHGCICSSKFLVAGDYCVKVRTMLGEAPGSFACLCGCLPPPTPKGIMMVQNNSWGRVICPVTLDT